MSQNDEESGVAWKRIEQSPEAGDWRLEIGRGTVPIIMGLSGASGGWGYDTVELVELSGNRSQRCS